MLSLILNLKLLRWLKAKVILRQFDDAVDWVFNQPSVEEIDKQILATEAFIGELRVRRQTAPDDYEWDYMKTTYPEPPPKWKYDNTIREEQEKLKRLHKRLDRESFRFLGQLTYPPQFN
ncbi:MAG: hypothetical protein WC553_02470 [Patescibacteria group bacterium]|jgi:hypothetical protein